MKRNPRKQLRKLAWYYGTGEWPAWAWRLFDRLTGGV